MSNKIFKEYIKMEKYKEICWLFKDDEDWIYTISKEKFSKIFKIVDDLLTLIKK